jgi:hypothetical protein
LGSVRESVWASVRESVWKQIYGSHDAGWLAFYDFFYDVVGLQCCEPLRGITDLAKCCGWWAPYKDFVAFQHRHESLSRDENGRLHNESGMAVRYRDGWGVWAIHGVRVDEQVVLQPHTQTRLQIDAEGNAEIKRIRIERFGWPRYLRESGARVLDVRDNAIEATRESLMETKDGARVLVCACPSTARVYALRIPREIASCENAQRWLHGNRSLRVVGRS